MTSTDFYGWRLGSRTLRFKPSFGYNFSCLTMFQHPLADVMHNCKWKDAGAEPRFLALHMASGGPRNMSSSQAQISHQKAGWLEWFLMAFSE